MEIHIKIENLFLISPPLGRRGWKLKTEAMVKEVGSRIGRIGKKLLKK